MRIAIVYDCLFPNTVGGAERWYRNLAERLDQRHSITYLTRRQWGEEGPRRPFGPSRSRRGGELYTPSGRRRIWPPLRFGIGVFLHLLRHGRRYDAVHSASFPVLLAARRRAGASPDPLARPPDRGLARGLGTGLLALVPGADRRGGSGSRSSASACALPDRSFTFSRLAERPPARARPPGADRSAHRGVRGRRGGSRALVGTRREDPPLVVAAGRHIPEKRVPSIPGGDRRCRASEIPELRCVILGDGPDAELIGS